MQKTCHCIGLGVASPIRSFVGLMPPLTHELVWYITRVATCSSNLRTEWLNRLIIHCGDREVHGSIPWIGRVCEFISLPPQATTIGLDYRWGDWVTGFGTCPRARSLAVCAGL